MCLAIPMKILEVLNNKKGICEVGGVSREVNLSFIKDPEPSQYVIVHAGFAIERLNEDDALERIEYFHLISQSSKKT